MESLMQNPKKAKSRRISTPDRDRQTQKQENHVQFDLLLLYNIAATLTIALSLRLIETSLQYPDI
jgi:hypothetical protein